MKPPSKRIVIWIVLALILVVVLGLALAPRPVPADFAGVDRGSLIVTLDEEGETRVRDRFLISAPLAGRVLRNRAGAGGTRSSRGNPFSRLSCPTILRCSTRGPRARRRPASRPHGRRSKRRGPIARKPRRELDYARGGARAESAAAGRGGRLEGEARPGAAGATDGRRGAVRRRFPGAPGRYTIWSGRKRPCSSPERRARGGSSRRS